MRRLYIHQLKTWPKFKWVEGKITEQLIALRHSQGKLIGQMESLGFQPRAEANLKTLTLDVLKSSEIEGEILNPDQVRSSVARRLGMDIAGLVPADRHVDGVVEMMLDATQQYQSELDKERLFAWHSSLFPTSSSGMHKIVVGAWRNNSKDDPMQVVSGPMGKERVHYQAPDSYLLNKEMAAFLYWFNYDAVMNSVLKAAIAHLWFVTIHPFDDGNGRIARAIADMQLAKADESTQRFYSMSAQIRKERNTYYDLLEKTQKGSLDVTDWLEWFMSCLSRSLVSTEEVLSTVLGKARFWTKHQNTDLNDRQKKVVTLLFDEFVGKLTSSKWAKITKVSQDTAGRDINELIALDILEKEQAGGRSTNYGLKQEVFTLK